MARMASGETQDQKPAWSEGGEKAGGKWRQCRASLLWTFAVRESRNMSWLLRGVLGRGTMTAYLDAKENDPVVRD